MNATYNLALEKYDVEYTHVYGRTHGGLFDTTVPALARQYNA